MSAETQTFEIWYKESRRHIATITSIEEYDEILSDLFQYTSSIIHQEIEQCYDLFSQILLHALEDSYQIISEYSFEILNAGFNAYNQKAFREAEGYFSLISTEDTSAGNNNLAYMIRRNEVCQPQNKYFSKALLLLRNGVEENDPFSLINTALTLALNLGSGEQWLLADQLVKRIAPSQIDGIVNWWTKVGHENDSEGYLVHLWLFRNGLITESDLGTHDNLCEMVKKAYSTAPDWLYEMDDMLEE